MRQQVTLKGLRIPHSGFRILWVKTIATWKTVIESMQSLGMEWHIPDFSLSILTILLDFTMAKRLRNGKIWQISPLTPRPKLNGRQNF